MIATVVPCFNEVDRLDLPALSDAIDGRPDWAFIFVDDGSTDATSALLEQLHGSHGDRVSLVQLETNLGKGEAVRRGMLAALDIGADAIAYMDADLSTPFEELDRLVHRLMTRRDLDIVMGARVRRLGADITRNELRHLSGRVYGTVASLALGVGVYDTQCGAKIFRRTPSLMGALAVPFTERWAFDVELLSRITRTSGLRYWERVLEEPLDVWHARPGSKLSGLAAVLAGIELLRIGWRHRRSVAQSGTDGP